jgi:hypothetical protein
MLATVTPPHGSPAALGVRSNPMSKNQSKAPELNNKLQKRDTKPVGYRDKANERIVERTSGGTHAVGYCDEKIVRRQNQKLQHLCRHQCREVEHIILLALAGALVRTGKLGWRCTMCCGRDGALLPYQHNLRSRQHFTRKSSSKTTHRQLCEDFCLQHSQLVG